MINVFLDDLRRCPNGFVHARTAEECILLLDECEINILSLDHDLGAGRPTGFDVTKHMAASGRFAKEIYLHTSSAIGKSNMFQLLYRHKPEGVSIHSHPMPEDVLAKAAQAAKTAE